MKASFIIGGDLIMYKREKITIPYQTAVSMAEVLEIDKKLLFDNFARFIDHPYSDKSFCMVLVTGQQYPFLPARSTR